MRNYAEQSEEKPIDLCERSFAFSVRIVKLCQVLLKGGGIGRAISRQLLRSGTSVGANIEEGRGAQSRADFASKYAIARKEARETLYWLRLLAATELMKPDRLSAMIQECGELIAIMTAIIKKTERPKR